MPHYDDLLFSRVKQLREIDERLERFANVIGPMGWQGELQRLRYDLAKMIADAEQEHAEF